MLLKKDKEKKLFFKESVFKVAELIFNYPNKTFYIRKLSKETKLSTTAIVSAVKELNKFKIIKIEKIGLITNIKADLESESYRIYKLIFNLYRLEQYGLIQSLKEIYKPETILVFGSFAKGEDIEKSDIDILIITPKKANVNSYLKGWEEKLKRKINLYILPNLSKSSKEFKNSVANGIVLYGYLKVV